MSDEAAPPPKRTQTKAMRDLLKRWLEQKKQREAVKES